jgi:hypothetical protein
MIKDITKKNWVVGNSSTILDQIHDSSINIAIYEREIIPISNEIETLLNQSIEIRVSGDVALIIQTVQKELGHFELIKNDIVSLLHLFTSVTKVKSFRLLLAPVKTNMCTRFHTDINDLRLLCTYSGPGTLWLEEDNVNREALDAFGDNECIVLDDKKIKQVNVGAVVILKGAIYPCEGTKAIVHRSPTIEENGLSRLLLRIDTNEFLNFN